MTIVKKIGLKSSDKEKIVEQVIKNPECLPEIIEGLHAKKGAVKFGCEKVLRLVSEKKPELVYPFFDVFAALLDSENNFLKWGAILTVANLTVVDSENKFEKIFEKYYAPVTGPAVVTAANIMSGSVVIAGAKPELLNYITRKILKVEQAQYRHHGKLSPECYNVACGHAIHYFHEVFNNIEDKEKVAIFVKNQLENTRKPVVKKAIKFLKKYAV
ncbi:MAG: hypothetical protein JXB48_12755 [Candidatus Latescibacteria bacterium]|nr:hypothetical protein [Candidatus Latescibacterota bacterium]